MKCPKCGAENSDENKFCTNCNNDLKIDALLLSNNVEINLDEVIGNSKNKNKSNKLIKIIVIIIFAIGILLILSSIVMTVFEVLSGPKNEKYSYDLDAYIRIEKNEKYGFIDTDGKMIIEPKLDYATDFVNGYALAKDKSDNKTPYHIIDKEGNVVLKAETDVKYNDKYKYWIVNEKYYNEKMKQVTGDDVEVDYSDYNEGYLEWHNKKAHTGGILSPTGKVTYEYKFAKEFEHLLLDVSENEEKLKEHYCTIVVFKDNDEDEEAIINCDTGYVVYNYTKESIYVDDYNVFKIGDKQVYVQNNKIVYETKDKNIDIDYDSDGYIEIEDNNKEYGDDGKYQYIDIKTGKIVNKKDSNNDVDLEELNEWEQLTKYKIFDCEDKNGIMNDKKVIIPCEWNKIDNLNSYIDNYLYPKGKQYVLAEKNNKTYLLNIKNKKTVAEFDSTIVYSGTTSSYLYYMDKDKKKLTIYNLITNKEITIDADTSTYINGYFNYITVKKDNKKTYYNIDLKEIYKES